MAKSNKKKNKPYYEKKISTQETKKKDDKQLMSNSSFVMGLGFLVWMYSRYISKSSYSMLTSVLGLGVMLYGTILNYKKDKAGAKQMTKTLKFVDYSMITIVAIGLVFYIFIMFKMLSAK